MSRHARQAAIIAALTLISGTSVAASYTPPAYPPPIEFRDVLGQHATGFQVDPPVKFHVEGPAALLLSCYRGEAGKFALKVSVDGKPSKTLGGTAKPTHLKDQPAQAALGAAHFNVAAGAHELEIAGAGCTLAISGADYLPAPKEPAPLIAPAKPPPAAPPEVKLAAAEPKPEPTPAPAPMPAATVSHPAAPQSGSDEKLIRASLRVGALVPRTELGSGVAIAGDVSYALPVLEHRLSASLGVGYALSPYQGPKIIPGRGYDPNFVQNTTMIPVALAAIFRQPVGPPGFALYGGVGFELLFVSADFSTFSAASSTRDTTAGIAFQGGVEYPAGPGALVADLRYTEARADLGPLGDTGQDALGHFLITGGYAMRF